ncbi:hypothetical protein GL267_003895 [Acidithiobacillus ferrianus]|uniref:Guanylate kinase/L-type calcium channel beta subunit domain-containing protein n=2 Tax=Acidithiobacillus ferrianus TaxID=2678518 RepID=A0A845U2V1_9PROT|nr:hypothetical protein [Acidithiobacillus ferrianus]NDU41243.1 hypothetical protein [Acidithiobacillus ferrianus]
MDDPKKILIMSGTPASGKDTLTALLESMSCGKCVLFKKHKMVTNIIDAVQDPRNTVYHLVDEATFHQMIVEKQFLQYHNRYGNGYGIAWSTLEKHWQAGQVPVLHNGKQENLRVFFREKNILVFSVLLMANQDDTKDRILTRNGGDETDAEKRLRAYVAEREEFAMIIGNGESPYCHLAINTDWLEPPMTASIIYSAIEKFWAARKS